MESGLWRAGRRHVCEYALELFDRNLYRPHLKRTPSYEEINEVRYCGWGGAGRLRVRRGRAGHAQRRRECRARVPPPGGARVLVRERAPFKKLVGKRAVFLHPSPTPMTASLVSHKDCETQTQAEAARAAEAQGERYFLARRLAAAREARRSGARVPNWFSFVKTLEGFRYQNTHRSCFDPSRSGVERANPISIRGAPGVRSGVSKEKWPNLHPKKHDQRCAFKRCTRQSPKDTVLFERVSRARRYTQKIRPQICRFDSHTKELLRSPECE